MFINSSTSAAGHSLIYYRYNILRDLHVNIRLNVETFAAHCVCFMLQNCKLLIRRVVPHLNFLFISKLIRTTQTHKTKYAQS